MTQLTTLKKGFPSLFSNDWFIDGVEDLNTLFSSSRTAQTFPVDIKEDDSTVTLEAELPGINKEDIKIDYENNILSIATNQNTTKDDTGTIYQERLSKVATRSFKVGEINFKKASANHTNGILTITLPKAEEKKKKNIKYKLTHNKKTSAKNPIG